MGYACYQYGYVLGMIVTFIIASFVFSIIFWITQKWLDEQSKKVKKKK